MPTNARTITEAAKLIGSGELTPSTLLDQCLERIDRYESKVHAWAYLDRERAREEADVLTRELKEGKNRGALHGIPIGVKDVVDVFDMPTGCGSKLWANSYARRDATCVARLRQAGAVILGKTVTTAYASFDPSITRNPWNLERTPGGSSSGSAAAVACGMCLGALGTQTGGSITRPASFCGVCSLKPTYGRVSVDGVLPLAPSLDHVGVMANCVRDLAILFQAMAGPDQKLGWSLRGHYPIDDIVCRIDEQSGDSTDPDLCALGGLFTRHLDQEVSAEYGSLMDHLEREVTLFERTVPPSEFSHIVELHRIVMAVQAAGYHSARLARLPEDYPPRVRMLIEEGMRCNALAYREALQASGELSDAIDRMLNGERIFLTPATTGPAPGLETTGDPICNSPWSFTGSPTISVPYAWSSNGLPLAAQLVSASMCEDDLFEAAAWMEQLVSFEQRTLPL